MAGHTHETIDGLFGQHKMTDEQFKQFQEIKERFRDLAHWVKDNVPGCALQTTAINKLFEAKNAATVAYMTEVVVKSLGPAEMSTVEKIAQEHFEINQGHLCEPGKCPECDAARKAGYKPKSQEELLAQVKERTEKMLCRP